MDQYDRLRENVNILRNLKNDSYSLASDLYPKYKDNPEVMQARTLILDYNVHIALLGYYVDKLESRNLLERILDVFIPMR